MKKATLIGMIGAMTIAFLSAFNMLTNILELSYVISIYKVTNVIGLAGWICIVYFFVTLYKNKNKHERRCH